MLPRNRDMREPSRPICRDIGYWKMIIITPLMDISRPYCCGLKTDVVHENTESVPPTATSQKEQHAQQAKSNHCGVGKECFSVLWISALYVSPYRRAAGKACRIMTMPSPRRLPRKPRHTNNAPAAVLRLTARSPIPGSPRWPSCRKIRPGFDFGAASVTSAEMAGPPSRRPSKPAATCRKSPIPARSSPSAPPSAQTSAFP